MKDENVDKAIEICRGIEEYEKLIQIWVKSKGVDPVDGNGRSLMPDNWEKEHPLWGKVMEEVCEAMRTAAEDAQEELRDRLMELD